MWFYFWVFIFPWIIFWIVSNKFQLRKLFITGTFGAMIALIVDIFQHSFKWWDLKEDIIPGIDVELSADLGLYPVQAMLLVQLLHKDKSYWLYYILGFSCFNTVGEYILFKLDKLTFSNGWNLGWSFISYIIPFSLVALHSIYYDNHIT